MKIYTRTGDRGTTSLFGGKRVSKSSARIEAIGTIDELNSAIGIIVAENKNSKIKNELLRVQGELFDIGALLATPTSVEIPSGKKLREELPHYLKMRVNDMEKLIDELTVQLTPMKTFILPGGTMSAAFLHQARTICRRAERRIVTLLQQEYVDSAILMYMNRLSDLLFTMARFENHKTKHHDIFWKSSIL